MTTKKREVILVKRINSDFGLCQKSGKTIGAHSKRKFRIIIKQHNPTILTLPINEN